MKSLFLAPLFLLPILSLATPDPQITSAPQLEPRAQQCGGIAGRQCPKGYLCVDKPHDGCDPNKGGRDCIGTCVRESTLKSCGGFLGTPCKQKGYICVDDPRDDCNPKAGGADCPGICVKRPHQHEAHTTTKLTPCGGFAGTPCKRKGYHCVDDPRDSCNPDAGGADCPGVCVSKNQTVPCGYSTICIDYVNDCGEKYGGCYDTCKTTTFTPPPCPYATPTPTPTPSPRLCGTRGAAPCPAGKKCVDNPSDGCDPKRVADCPGICVDEKPRSCGGFRVEPKHCPKGEVCVYDADPRVSDKPGVCAVAK